MVARWNIHHFFLPSLAAASSFSFSRALLALVPVKRSNLWWWSPTNLMSPLSVSSLIRLRATDPFTLNFSHNTARVMQRIFGASVRILSYFFCSRNTSLLALSLVTAFPHFLPAFFTPLAFWAWALFEALAAFYVTLWFLSPFGYNKETLQISQSHKLNTIGLQIVFRTQKLAKFFLQEFIMPALPLVTRLLRNRNLMNTYHLLFLEPDLNLP